MPSLVYEVLIEDCPNYILQCIFECCVSCVCFMSSSLRRRMPLCLMTMGRIWPVYRHCRESMKDLKYVCCILTTRYHAIIIDIVKKSPI